MPSPHTPRAAAHLCVLLTLFGMGPFAAPREAAPQQAAIPTPAPVLAPFAGPTYGLDGTGPAASFSDPYDIDISPSADFALVTDSSSHTLRRIDLATNLATTFAGAGGLAGEANGVGAAARFDGPTAVSINGDGSFALVRDANGLRRVDLISGNVSTIAGNADLNYSHRWSGLALSADGSYALLTAPSFAGTIEIQRLSIDTGELATVASFASDWETSATSIALSVDGRFALVSDYDGDRILRVDLPSGAITVLAGASMDENCTSSDGVGTAARLCQPLGLSLSRDGSFAIFTNNNVLVRRLEVATGAVTTVAGSFCGSGDGIGPGARFCNLQGSAISPNGSYALVADGSNGLIRRVQLTPNPPLVANQVTTLAGNLPFGLADGTGTVARLSTRFSSLALSPNDTYALVADVGNQAIRRLQVADGAVASGTLTTPWRGVESPRDITISADGTFGLVAQRTFVSRIELGSTTPTSPTLLAGSASESGANDGVGTAARFGNATAIALSPDSRYALVVDSQNQTIRRVEVQTGAVTTFAGAAGQSGSADGVGGAARFLFEAINGPDTGSDIVISHNNAFALVSDSGNRTVRKIDIPTATVTTLAGAVGTRGEDDGVGAAARFDSIGSLALSADDRYALLADNAQCCVDGRVRQIDMRTGSVTTLASYSTRSTDGLPLTGIGGIALSADGSFALLANPWWQNQIRRMGAPLSVAGRVTTLAGVAGEPGSADGQGRAARFRDPRGIAMSETGIAMVADTGNHTLRRIAIPNGDVFTIAGAAGQPGAANGNGPQARFNGPLGVAVDRIATFALVADTGNHAIRRVSLLSGSVSTVAGQLGAPGSADGPAGQSSLNAPAAVAIDRTGTFALVADTGNHTLRRLDLASGQLSTLAGVAGQPGELDGVGSAARFTTPIGVSISCDSSFALVAEGGGAVRRVDLASAEVSTVPRPAQQGSAPAQIGGRPIRVTSLPNAEIGLLADPESNSVASITLVNGALVTVAGTAGEAGSADGVGTAARFNQPTDLAAACNSLQSLVLDSTNQTVRPFDLRGILLKPAAHLPLIQR